MEKLNEKSKEIKEKTKKNLDKMTEILNNAYKEKTYERHDVEDTPFSIIIDQKGDCQIAVGNNLMLPYEFPDEQSAKDCINEKPWELLLNTMALLADNIYKINEQSKTNENA